MNNVFGTEIFWITLLIAPIIFIGITFIGFACFKLFRLEFEFDSGFYVAPAIGLAVLVILSSSIGRVTPLGNSGVVVFLLFFLLAAVFMCRNNIYQIFQNSLIVSIFGIVCGISIMVPLFFYGAFNSHNDAFTYLAHSDWLQNHAFNEIIPVDGVTPLTTQIALYQAQGLRMGGSFLLALVQSLFNLHWSFDAYSVIIIIAMTVCCLAIGFPLTQIFSKVRHRYILLLLTLPALSLGGLVFGANFGFLPQTLGLALGIAFLVLMGFCFNLIITKFTMKSFSGLAFLCALLFSGAVFVYSELVPFLLLAIAISGLYFAIKYLIFKKLFIFSSLFLGFSIILLNFEIIRAAKALLTQSSAIVGTAVNWPLFGYIAHAFGIHGGAWDGVQWSVVTVNSFFPIVFNILFVGFLLFFIIYIFLLIKKSSSYDIILPIFIMVIVLTLFFIYFRYFIQSPFLIGKGQSWSQFKISDWVNPFLMLLFFVTLLSFRDRYNRVYKLFIPLVFVVAFLSTPFFSLGRIQSLLNNYERTNNLSKYYINFREQINTLCPLNAPVYLNLGVDNLKFRQMATLYLYDREVKSNWLDDVYIYIWLPSEKKAQWPKIGDCVVELKQKDDYLDTEKGVVFGKFRVGLFKGSMNIGIDQILGAYGDETDGENYWNWVKNNVTYILRPYMQINPLSKIRLYFEYNTLGSRTLELSLIKNGKVLWSRIINSQGDAATVFDEVIKISPNDFTEINIKTDSIAESLSKNDSRLASFIIRNLQVLEYK